MVSRSACIAVLLFCLASPALAKLESGYGQTQSIFLSSDSEVPAERSGRSAIISLTFNATSICYALGNITIPPATPLFIQSVAIYTGKSGASGPLLVTLGDSTGTSSLRSFSTCASADPRNISAILANPSNYYVNVLASSYSAGAFRGQLGSTFTVNLVGSNEVPKVNSTAAGSVEVTIGDTYVCYNNLSINTPLLSITQGHIHSGSSTDSGPIVVPLFTGVPSSSNCTGLLNNATTASILKSAANYYVNVHTTAYPAGAARSQLVSANDFSAYLTLYATSAAEIGLVTNNTATGQRGNVTVSLTITPTNICFAILNMTANLSSFTQGHIHQGAADVSGPILIPLFAAKGVASACVNVNDTGLMTDLIQNPDQYYFNVHNADYPAGVARAQLGPALTVPLFGSEETPASNFTGSIIITLGYSSVCYSNLTYSGLRTNLTQGHIHSGGSGVSGPVLIPLFTGVPPAYACTPVAPSVIAPIIANPAAYYANVHSTLAPAGVIRHQLGTNETVLSVF
eukprot:TRINITY_DN14030_c0_g1_i1.p1 TRINITY_DN14030_c0_g1~~TRINITY_DN14030_c0_g1_i1.p1  ORF type:complete len:514 (-),score=67.99 TRINITY_DN14030_c0_g1_i1:464-2005(-)